MCIMEDTIYISPEDFEIVDAEDYSHEVSEHFSDMLDVSKPLLKSAKKTFKKIEKMLAPFRLGAMPEIPAAVTVNRANQILNSF